jgi:hypothetical protein
LSDGRLLVALKLEEMGHKDAQRSAVPQTALASYRTISRSAARLLLVVSGLLLGPAAAGAASGGVRVGDGAAGETAGNSVISGVVRDAQGVAQMGALVQVLTANSISVAAAFTDQRGHYSIPNLAPGLYLVRASATLFVPVTKANLRLWAGTTTVVNLTMAALFDSAAWLPAQRRRADETTDDWKWTLRSTAHRPILRIVEEGDVIEVSSSASEAPAPIRAKAQGALESGDGGFGQGGVHSVETLHSEAADGSDMIFRADMSTVTRPPDGGQHPGGSEFDMGFESRTGYGGGATRSVVTYMAHPELLSQGFDQGFGGGLEVLQISSAQRINLGDRVDVEAGGRIEAVHAGAAGFATYPFLKVSAHPAGEWTLEYRMATNRELQQFDDVTTGGGEVPVALVRDGKLALESGRHQEAAVSHRSGRTSVEVAFYRDALHQTSVSGGEAAPTPSVVNADEVRQSTLPGYPLHIAQGMVLDPITGSFRAIGGGYTDNGVRAMASSALTPSLWIAAEYSSGEALTTVMDSSLPAPRSFAEALSGLKAERSESATLALKGKLVGLGTRVRASYRWQPTRGVTAVDPYSAFGDQAYLSCLVRQSIRAGRLIPQGLEATIDVTNLLAQGYRPFLSADGQTLYFAQAPRTIQAGLSFSF